LSHEDGTFRESLNLREDRLINVDFGVLFEKNQGVSLDSGEEGGLDREEGR
jgi:hypothetical protein